MVGFTHLLTSRPCFSRGVNKLFLFLQCCVAHLPGIVIDPTFPVLQNPPLFQGFPHRTSCEISLSFSFPGFWSLPFLKNIFPSVSLQFLAHIKYLPPTVRWISSHLPFPGFSPFLSLYGPSPATFIFVLYSPFPVFLLFSTLHCSVSPCPLHSLSLSWLFNYPSVHQHMFTLSLLVSSPTWIISSCSVYTSLIKSFLLF